MQIKKTKLKSDFFWVDRILPKLLKNVIMIISIKMRYISIVETTLWINFNYNKIKRCHLCCFSKILFYRYNLFFHLLNTRV